MSTNKLVQGFGARLEHPVFQSWSQLVPREVELIYVKGAQVYTEHTIRGDQVGYVTKAITTLAHDFKPSVWALELSCMHSHWSIVFAPADFDIHKFHRDLSRLFFMGTLVKMVNRGSLLEDWELPAYLLSPGISWGEAQGWWHTGQKVIVVCLTREGGHDLWKYLDQTFSITKGQRVEIRNPALHDFGLLEAMELLQPDIRQNPRS